MPSAEWGLFKSIFVALALVYHTAASAFQSEPEEDEPASVPSMSTKMTDVILVSKKPWNEAHASFARLLGGPITTWGVTNEKLAAYVERSILQFKKPIVVAAGTSEPFETILTMRHELRYACPLTWLFVRHHSQIRNQITSSWPPLTTCGTVGVLGMNSTVIKSIFWPHGLLIDHNPGSKKMLAKLRIPHRSNVNYLIGQQLTMFCPEKLCEYEAVKYTLALFIVINVTVKPLAVPADRFEELLLSDSWNIMLYPFYVITEFLQFFDIPLSFLDYDTFYSRVDCQRAITLVEAAGESWKLVITTVFLLALVVVVSVAVGEKGWSAVRRFSDTAMFLLAAVLGTSAVQPDAVRLMAVPRKALLGLWLVAILPLSVYFRTELTSILTLKRPAYRIDTLQKLEDALDRNEVAPCVLLHSPFYDDLNEKVHNVTQCSLMKKLQLAFATHGNQALAKETHSACLQCALRRDRVCFSRAGLLSSLPNKCPSVRAFFEPFRMQPWGYFMHKYDKLYEPLRRFFLAAQESGLLPQLPEEYHYGAADNQFDGSSLFVLLGILHSTSCLVLVLEILFACCVWRM